jgi:hypothetical protein
MMYIAHLNSFQGFASHGLPFQLGPDVVISARARIGAGVRVSNSIVLDEVHVKVRRVGQKPRLRFGFEGY